MIPLIHQTPRLTLLAASRALLTAELHKPRYFPLLLGATIPETWPPGEYDEAAMHYFLDQLTIGGRHAAGWYGWYAIRKATPGTPKTLIGAGGFMGPPDAGTVEIGYSVVEEWRGQGLATELVAGLLEQAANTGMVRHVVAHTFPDNTASQQVLLANNFQATGTNADGRLRFERAVEPVVPV
ncbi:GNAT family N-acetyltransferase [Hymenobacter sp. BT186]|uniref:GNAT family N-acetyltransferase n=1 Tax=Hymenobacter telluris TaxID=2816474 RepID=A0A939JEU1_9BACT|nr:GNAT family N-acetyltransferase [Hymenobacter telluris]MBO0360313.1 GNAT family N-acetyltransferase [Hymenobacter telluris]MBW3376340.1 GNAT family N-acetyltransferase [Hymenobacter norwichensis]